MAFPAFLGFNFGKTSGKSSSVEDSTKTENIFQQSSQNTSGTTKTDASSTTDATGKSVSTQTGTQASDATKVSTGVGTTNLFGDPVLGGLQDAVLSMLNQTKSAHPVDLTALSGFNRDNYVKGVTDAAQSKSDMVLDATKGNIADMVGAKTDNSSMATLLANRATTDASAGVAGVKAQAEATANQILDQNANTAIAAKGADDGFMTQLLAALKGGTQTTTTAANEGSTGTTTNSATGTTDSSESTKVASTSLQTIQQLVNALLTGTDTTVGHLTTSGKTSGTTLGVQASVGSK